MTTILISGKNGQVGRQLQRELAPLGRIVALDRSQMDLADSRSIRDAVRATAPDVIVNAAGYTAVDRAEAESSLALQVNALAPGVIAEEAKRIDALLIHYSTDYVFDGSQTAPYREDDAVNPLGVYGSSKLAGERAVADAGCAFLILRTSWLFSAQGSNFMPTVLRLARAQGELPMVMDQVGCPTWARSLARSTAELISKPGHIRERSGVYHLCSRGSASRYAFAQAIIDTARERAGCDTGWAILQPVATTDYPRPAARPPRAVLSCDKIRRDFDIEMPEWQQQVRECMREWTCP